MDEAGVRQAAIVQASTCYGYDNSYLADSIAGIRRSLPWHRRSACSGRPATICKWLQRGVSGLRLFTGGSTKGFDRSSVDDPGSVAAWELCADAGVAICLQTDPTGLAKVAGLAKRFPKVKIILDHLSRPDIADGPPYKKASSLFGLQPFENIHLKLTPRTVDKSRGGAATPETFFPKLVEVFGSRRIAWGSNFPASAGTLPALLNDARAALGSLSDDDRAWIFGKTALTLYPKLVQS